VCFNSILEAQNAEKKIWYEMDEIAVETIKFTQPAFLTFWAHFSTHKCKNWNKKSSKQA
jgi:hypothetical protein